MNDKFAQDASEGQRISKEVLSLWHKELYFNLIRSLVFLIIFSATKVYIDDVLTCRAWKCDSVAKKKTTFFIETARSLLRVHGLSSCTRTAIWAGTA